LETLNKKALEAMCRNLGLKVTGNKAVLIDRIETELKPKVWAEEAGSIF